MSSSSGGSGTSIIGNPTTPVRTKTFVLIIVCDSTVLPFSHRLNSPSHLINIVECENNKTKEKKGKKRYKNSCEVGELWQLF